jgi:hypothetical protein
MGICRILDQIITSEIVLVDNSIMTKSYYRKVELL